MLTRTQLMLDIETKMELERQARLSGESMSKTARKILQEELSKKKRDLKPKVSAVRALLELSKNAVEGPGDSEYDRYAYDF